LICDPHAQEALVQRGDDPHQLVDTYADVLSRIAAGAPADVTIGMHMCRGNNRGKWMGSGGYEYVSEVVFQKVGIREFLHGVRHRARRRLRARCAMCRRAVQVILGLVSSKTPRLESRDGLKRRIDEAAKILPLDQLCLSPSAASPATSWATR
jgi:5-methyltetrahydropteroyltriglutamate--homocysteine methyltransferase